MVQTVTPTAAPGSRSARFMNAMNIIDLQRRQPGPRADELLAGLQAAVATDERVHWNESGHARLRVGQALEDARITVATRLAELANDWADHIAIL